MKSIRFFLVGLLFCAALSVPAQNSFDRQRADSLFHLLDAHQKLMGSISLFEDGKEIYQNQIGLCNATDQLPVVEHSVFRVGSVSKMFTAVMILQLMEESKLQPETPLAEFFPQIPHASSVTIDQMLGHRSGIHSFTDDTAYLSYLEEPQTQADLLARIAGAKPEFSPDSTTAYSNSNYVLLGYIIERITGSDYATNLQLRIAKPLGLTQTRYGTSIANDSMCCYSYRYEGVSLIPETETHLSIPGGAGAIVSTPAELNQFITALFSGKLINDASLQKMTTLHNHFGYGIFAMNFFEHQGFGHTGGIDGFQSVLSWFPAERLAVAICVNAAGISLNEVLIGVLSMYYGRDYTFPSFATVQVPEALLKSYAGIYSTPDFPLKMTITFKDNLLFAQATNQSAFPLTPTDDHTFRFDPAGIVILFHHNTLTIKQGGFDMSMKKE